MRAWHRIVAEDKEQLKDRKYDYGKHETGPLWLLLIACMTARITSDDAAELRRKDLSKCSPCLSQANELANVLDRRQ